MSNLESDADLRTERMVTAAMDGTGLLALDAEDLATVLEARRVMAVLMLKLALMMVGKA